MYFRREEDDNYSLELTPLVDVVFLLLIFFMVSTAFVEFPHQLEINLPQSKISSQVTDLKTLEIEMTKDGLVFLNGKMVSMNSLEQKIEEAKKTHQKKALVRADKGLPYGNVVKVMGILQAAEIKDISIAVK